MNIHNIIQPTKIITNIHDLSGHVNFAFLTRPNLNLLNTKVIAADWTKQQDRILMWTWFISVCFTQLPRPFVFFYGKRSTLSPEEPEGPRRESDVWKTNTNEIYFLCEVIFQCQLFWWLILFCFFTWLYCRMSSLLMCLLRL